MKFTYRLSEDASGWLAECVESEAAGEGKTSAEAVRSLAVSLEERMLRHHWEGSRPMRSWVGRLQRDSTILSESPDQR